MNQGRHAVECRVSDQAADAAGCWDARLRSPECTAEERAKFAVWRDANPENRLAFERAQTIALLLRNSVGRADVRALRDSALRAQQPRSLRRWAAAALTVATLAVAAVALNATLGPHWRTSLHRIATLVENALGSNQDNILQTGIGQRSTVTMRDGSTVELNANTRIKLTFSDAARHVELVHGQALFHVTKDPRRPFVVRAADRDITAVGTAFDVRLKASSVQVTLLEGKVRVTREEQLATSDSTDKVDLTPGQQFVASMRPGSDAASQQAFVRTIDVAKAIGWREGRIFLDDLTLAEAVAEMNNYSPVQIRIDDSALTEARINGMFRAGEQQAFVSALRHYFPLVARVTSDTQIILEHASR